MLRRALRMAIIIGLLLLTATGCWDQRELEERAIVLAIGIDVSEEKPGQIQLSFQVPIPLKIAGAAGGGGGDGDVVHILKGTGRTVLEAYDEIQKQVNQQVFFGHTRVLALSEEIAKQGLERITDPFHRGPQIRRLLWPLVVKGRAIDLLTSNPELEQIPTVYLLTMIENGVQLRMIPEITLGGLYVRKSSKSEELFLNYFEAFEKKMEWEGIVVFKDDKMVGQLSTLQTSIFMQLWNGKSNFYVTFPYDEKEEDLVTLLIQTDKVEKKISREQGVVKAKLHIFAEADLSGKPFPGSFAGQEAIRKLEQATETYLEERAKEIIASLQNEYQSDIIGLGSEIKAYYPEIWDEIKDTDYFKQLDIEVSYELKLRRLGMLSF